MDNTNKERIKKCIIEDFSEYFDTVSVTDHINYTCIIKFKNRKTDEIIERIFSLNNIIENIYIILENIIVSQWGENYEELYRKLYDKELPKKLFP